MLSTSRVSRPSRSRRVTTNSSPGRRNSMMVASSVRPSRLPPDTFSARIMPQPLSLELGKLGFEVLVGRADAGVTDAGHVGVTPRFRLDGTLSQIGEVNPDVTPRDRPDVTLITL